MLLRQNYVAEKDFHKNYTKRFVAATCRCDMLLQLAAQCVPTITITCVARSGLGTRLNRKRFLLRNSCLILLTCAVSISFSAACLSKVKFIFVVVTNACCVYFVYIYGAFIKYLKMLFSCVCCLPHRLTVKLCLKAVVKVKKANRVIIINYINPRRVA